MYDSILQFKGEWRQYQLRVLNHFDDYSQDHKIHIVAAPGSGKTTLGIEFIKRIGKPALIFAPTITIREQWIERIKEAFLIEGILSDDYLSQDLKDLKLITVTTYQSLHSAINHYQGKLIEEEGDDFVKEEEVDYHDYDFLEAIKKAQIGIVCLDECHHLRNEWWKSLEIFKKRVNIDYSVALTGTPPYDSTISMWNRYIEMCGEIDEEITVPELVKEGSLCPHQDYVYFNYPTKEEKKEINKFKQRSQDVLKLLMNDSQFQSVIQSHKCLSMQSDLDTLLEKPEYLSAILIYLESKQLSYPKLYQDILGFKKLEEISAKWIQILLQGLLYDDTHSYYIDETYKESLIKELKSNGLIENNKICFEVNKAIENMLVKSAGKSESIKEIVFHEYQCLNKELKLLILTDFIKKEHEKRIGDISADIHGLGVLPFFEMLRRENEKQGKDIQFGVLCGSLVIIPSIVKEKLISMGQGEYQFSFEAVGCLNQDQYLKVNVKGNRSCLTGFVSDLFALGYIQVLIGTKSLLGEGWDSPCVNTLILASFVGSFMLSNQMRGRAIRTLANHPEKTSHIWHLVCVEPSSDIFHKSNDLEMLERRMDNFLGLHYSEETIENGIGRLDAIRFPLNHDNLKRTNKQMLKLSSKRNVLKERWDHSLAIYEQIEVVDENQVKADNIIYNVFFDAIRSLLVLTICCLVSFILLATFVPNNPLYYLYFAILAGTFLFIAITPVKKIFEFANPMGKLKAFGNGIYQSLLNHHLFESLNSCVKTESDASVYVVYLSGGTGHDKSLFSTCIHEFFEPIDNQRYILYNPRRKNKMDGYFVIPEVFSKRKEDAILFAEYMKPFIGKYQVIYTRNVEGRKILLKGRIKALSNKQERCLTRKKVKGVLE